MQETVEKIGIPVMIFFLFCHFLSFQLSLLLTYRFYWKRLYNFMEKLFYSEKRSYICNRR